MTELSINPSERSRKAYAAVLQRLQEPGRGVAISSALGVSESTVSRIKTEHVEHVLSFLYALGFKLVSQEIACSDSNELKMLRQTYARAVRDEYVAARLFGGDE